MLKFLFEKDFEIESIKNILPSTIKKYFIKGYTRKEFLSFLKTEKQEKKLNP